MSIFYPINEFFESSGNVVAEFGEGLRDSVATHACTLWSLYPDYITQGANPGSSFARGFMNQMCSPLQPPVPAPSVPFTGGQCIGINYNVTVTVDLTDNLGNVTQSTVGGFFIGGIRSIYVFTPSSGPDQRPRLLVDDNEPDSPRTTVLAIYGNPTVSAEISDIIIARVDGQPDNCGNPPIQYPPTFPTQNDLSTTINIVNLDGVDNVYSLTYNKTNSSYNFPLTFKLGGVNATLDLSGITIYGDLNISSFNTGNNSPPPGSDGGEDVDGNPYVEVQDNEYPTLPPPALPEPVDLDIEYILCQEGVLETITEIIKVAPGIPDLLRVVLLLLSDIVSEICEVEDTEIGFPEVYPVLPGVERPAIVYYFKEFDTDNRKLPPTYTSTVSNPSVSAVAGINTVKVPDKAMGKYVISLKLLDGSRITSSGLDETAALVGYTFLLNQVDPTLVPPDQEFVRAVTFRGTLEERNVKCTQIEYYPFGKRSGVSPAIVRRIDPFA